MAEKTPAYVAFVSGTAAGCADTALNYPPYCLHYRFQRREDMTRRAIYAPRELYRGVGAYSAIIPITCLCDGLTEALEARGAPRHLAAITSGMTAALIVSAPIGNAIVVNLRLKAEGRPAGTKNALRHLWNTYGIKGFYAGIEPLMLREGIYSCAVFYAKGAIQEKFKIGDLSASMVAGSVATALSQPCDTSATFAQNKKVRVPYSQTIKEMWLAGGLRSFYRGFMYRWYAVVAGVYVMDSVSNAVKGCLTG